MEYQFIYDQCTEGAKIFDQAKILIDDGSKDSVYFSLAEQLRILQQRFSEQKLTILVAGEMKVGKSTFINSLLGIDILATAHEVCTNVPTKIVYGEEEKILVHFEKNASGGQKEPKIITRAEVAEYSTESANKENQNKVDYIEIQINSPFLAGGLAFIDTPGLGAVDPLHAITTYRMATQADIIFFLGDSRKPLTQSEIASLKDLVKVSGSQQILHLLTCCDMKKTDDILVSNQQMFEKDFAKYNIPIIKVSSLLYRKYVRSGNRVQLDSSGFQQIKSYIADINNDLKSLLNSRFRTLALDICSRGSKLLIEVIETVEDPVKKECKVAELQTLMDRLTEIEEKQSIWQQELSGQLSIFVSDLNNFINNQQTVITDNVSENLKSDSYLEDKDALSKSIAADLISFQNDLDKKISDGFIDLYEWLRTKTGLKKIQQEESIESLNDITTNISIGDNVGNAKFGQKVQGLYRSVFIGTGVAAAASTFGNWAGGAIGAKIGAAIGTGIAPGIGSAIGAAVGAIAGVLTGVISGWKIFKESKEERKRKQRNEIFAACKKQILEFFTKIKSEVDKARIAQSTELATQFIKEVRDEKKRLQIRIHRMQNEAMRVRANFDAIKKLVDGSKKVCENLQKK